MSSRLSRLGDAAASAPHGEPLSRSSRLRRMGSAHAAWAAQLARGVAVPLARAQGVAAGEVALHRLDAACWPQARAWPQLQLELAGAAAALRLQPHPQWCELEEPGFATLDAALKSAVAAHVSSEMRQAIGLALHEAGLVPATAAPALRDATGDASMQAPMLVVEVRLREAGAASNALPLLAWLGLGEHAPSPAAAPAAAMADVRTTFDPPLRARVVVARADIAAGALRELRAGSTVLLDRIGTDAANAWLWTGDAPAAQLRVGVPSRPLRDAAAAPLKGPCFVRWIGGDERRALARTQSLHRRQSMDFPDVSAQAGKNPVRSDDALAEVSLDVQAAIELPAARVSELRRWSPGMVLAGAMPVDGTQVKLLVSGQPVGRGRLVAVDSLLGFEVLELFD